MQVNADKSKLLIKAIGGPLHRWLAKRSYRQRRTLGIMVFSLLWVMQDLFHQTHERLGKTHCTRIVLSAASGRASGWRELLPETLSRIRGLGFRV